MFSRYGFKKTSMDDVARAAGLSRQGLYLHFPNKDVLFKAAVLQVVAAMRAACRAALADEGADIRDRLLDAFDAVHGHGVGQVGVEHARELLEAAAQLAGDATRELDDAIIGDVTKALRGSGIAETWSDSHVTARDLAAHLYTFSCGLKHRVTTRAAYRRQMSVAVTILCGRVRPEGT